MRLRINDLATIQLGCQFRERLEPKANGTHQVIQIKDIDAQNDHRLDSTNLCRIVPDKDASKYEVSDGDVIFLSKGRRNYATLIEGLSESQVRNEPDGSGTVARPKTIVAGYFFVLKITADNVRPDFLVWSINQPLAQRYLQSITGGTGMPFIRKDAFGLLEIDVPDMDTQGRIVELHRLSLLESTLLSQLREKRLELVRSICVNATREESPQGDNHGEQ